MHFQQCATLCKSLFFFNFKLAYVLSVEQITED